ncbi:protease 2 isoform X2 [Impatiens glandulifera]|uniref:protease 2 isoform X2 n=1 Tax=Impatiens glandulifera TaxID=253017 RepID=UPI001FB05588|nr:protease 2 isoform X2 [Impatiens glandulifera]
MATSSLLTRLRSTTKPFRYSPSLLCNAVSSSSFSSVCRADSPPFSHTVTPPVPKKVPFTVSCNGRTWEDPYHWMRNTNDPDFTSYLSQENSYAKAFMDDTHRLQHKLFEEMTSLMPAKISTPPERWGPWLYYQYIPEGKEFPVLCRLLASEEEGWLKRIAKHYMPDRFCKEQILLDWNEIAEQYGYVHVGTCRISPDHNFLAYTVDWTGDENFMLQIKDLSNFQVLPNIKINGVVSLAWAKDGVTLFYTVTDGNQRPCSVRCMRIGSDPIKEIPIFTEDNTSFCVDITSTKDGRFITINSNSRTSSEVYVLDAYNVQEGIRRFQKRVSGVKVFLEHYGGFFYILTNAPLNEEKPLPSESYCLARCRVENPDNWETIITQSEDLILQDMDVFNGFLVLSYDINGSSQICSVKMPIDVCNKEHKSIHDLDPWWFPQPSEICGILPGSNHDFMSSKYRVVLSSPVMPDVIIDYDMSRQTFSFVQQEEVANISSHKLLNGSDEKNHRVTDQLQMWRDFSDALVYERKEVRSHDGVLVPLTVLYSKKANQKNGRPGLMHCYGAYGEDLDKNWCSDRLSLLDRGWVIAFADVRGGGGGIDPKWHESGRGLCKLNSIYDFVACCNYMVSEGYVHEEKLSAIGHSAGGITVGATINMYPRLLRAAILKVPFLDICNTLLDPSLPLTILDYEEFGNPQIQENMEYILSYSPYDTIPKGDCLPSVLVTSSFHDSRVGVWEAAKWVAKVRETMCFNCSRSVILKTIMSGGGHFGEGGRLGQCEETAYEYAFLMKAMGMSDDDDDK